MYILLLPYFLYTYLKILHGMHMLQQNFYNEDNRYLHWILKNLNKSLITPDLFGLFLIILPIFKNDLIIYIGLFIFYSILFIYRYNIKKKEQVKKPLVYTFRIKRLVFTTLILNGIILYLLYRLNNNYVLVSVLALLAVFAYYQTYIAYLINLPIEKIIYNHYKRAAQRKLRELNTINIGITGSYGKTSSKNILRDILSTKYRTYASPGNLNTPLGLMRTVNNYLDKFEEVFIAEISISAPKTHDIKRSCDIVKPKYGIITNIGLAHLDSFKTQENIQKAKFELIENLPSNGIGVLNADDLNQVNYKIKNTCKIIWIGIDNKDKADIYAENIKCTYEGTTFDCVFKDCNKKISLKTVLFGKPNIYNILASLALARELKISYDDMAKGVANVKPIEHRLEMKRYPNYTIIDDAYNSNPVGSKMAVDVLGLMPGLKIIVTPGMIELSDKEYSLNYEFGKHISNVADYVILVGKNQTKPIYNGLIDSKYDSDKIFVLNDVKDAFPLIERLRDDKTYVLLENDLPDLFNEKK